MNRRLRVDYQKLEEVVLRLRQQRTSDDKESTFRFLTKEERVIGWGTPESFSKWNEEHSNVLCDLINGEIIIRELPSKEHATVESYLSTNFFLQSGPLGARHLTVGSNRDLLSGNNIFTPDITVGAMGWSTRGGIENYPVIIVEIGWTQRPLNLHDRAAIFLGARYPTIEYYVALYCYDATLLGHAMVAAIYTRANPLVPVSITSFGTAPLDVRSFWAQGHRNFPAVQGFGVGGAPPCNAPGIPIYILQFPPGIVFGSRVGGIPAGVLVPYTLDLFPVQVFYLER